MEMFEHVALIACPYICCRCMHQWNIRSHSEDGEHTCIPIQASKYTYPLYKTNHVDASCVKPGMHKLDQCAYVSMKREITKLPSQSPSRTSNIINFPTVCCLKRTQAGTDSVVSFLLQYFGATRSIPASKTLALAGILNSTCMSFAVWSSSSSVATGAGYSLSSAITLLYNIDYEAWKATGFQDAGHTINFSTIPCALSPPSLPWILSRLHTKASNITVFAQLHS